MSSMCGERCSDGRECDVDRRRSGSGSEACSGKEERIEGQLRNIEERRNDNGNDDDKQNGSGQSGAAR